MNDMIDSFMYCCAKITIDEKTVELLFSSEGHNPKNIVKPHILEKNKYGYSMIDIRNDYTSVKDIYSWVNDNYDLLMKHWFHIITDKELLNALLERR